MSEPKTRSERIEQVMSTAYGSDLTGREMTDLFERQGALGDFALQVGAGDIWSRPGLSPRDRSVVAIAMLTALGRDVELENHVGGGLEHGLERHEIDEIMVQLFPYVGIPFALGGASVVSEAFAEIDGLDQRETPPAPAEAKSDEKRRADGQDVLRTLLGMPDGSDMSGAADATIAQLGDMGELVLDFAFGDVWSRPQLSRRDRSLVVISALTACSLAHELEIHLGAALNHGVTREEVEEVMITAVLYGGFPRAIDGLRLARQVFEARDTAG